MKIIEALKQIKNLQKKSDDLRGKIRQFSAYLSYETPTYTEQNKQVKEWLQAHSDILKEILRLNIAIQKTNIGTNVTIELNGKNVTKSIAEWIHRRRNLANFEKQAWLGLTDKGLREGKIKKSDGETVDVKIVRCYNPVERDNMVASLDSEPTTIDSKLEIMNAITDIIE